jgi:hypothetical protein
MNDPGSNQVFGPTKLSCFFCIHAIWDDLAKDLIAGTPTWPNFPGLAQDAHSSIVVAQITSVGGAVSMFSGPPSWAK